jgi:hypothetical protein
MAFFRRFLSIPGAYRDLRRFLARRKPYELWFLLLAMVLTMATLVAFQHDSYVPVPYHENIIYVQSWRADRSEAEILAQQKIDMAAKAKQDAATEKLRKQRQAEFQELNNQVNAWHL